MKRFPLVMIMVCFAVLQLNAQNNTTTATKEAPNFFIITTDGLRWQELFNGMQDDIVNQKKFHRGDSNYLFNRYGVDCAQFQISLIHASTLCAASK